jgi:hypothetical protein
MLRGSGVKRFKDRLKPALCRLVIQLSNLDQLTMIPDLSTICLRCRCRTSRTYPKRGLSTTSVSTPRLRRAMLYVPGSNARMLEKSLQSPADSICYDLEDAVAPGRKDEARRMVCELLNVCEITGQIGLMIG